MDTVVYVDITRKPVDWFLSMYAWKRFGSHEEPHTGKRYTTNKVRGHTYGETLCIQSGDRYYM